MGYTRLGLVEEARAAGFAEAKERLITDWVELGLLDEGERRGRGKGGGRGAHYEWPDKQKDLFLALLQQRRGMKGVKGLASLPVAVWMYWGDDWIELRQVRKALRTWWSGAGEFRSRKRVEDNARMIVDAFSGSTGSRTTRMELQRVLADALDQRKFDMEQITPLVQDLLSSGPGKGSWGPFGFTAAEMVDGLRAMSFAIDGYEQISDGMFYEMRARHRQTVLAYLRDRPALANDPTYGSWFNEPDLEVWVNRACHDLLLELGLRMIANKEHRQLPPVELTPWTGPPEGMLRFSSSEKSQ